MTTHTSTTHPIDDYGIPNLPTAYIVTTYGDTPDDAIARVRQVQPLPVETRLQEAYVGQYAERSALTTG